MSEEKGSEGVPTDRSTRDNVRKEIRLFLRKKWEMCLYVGVGMEVGVGARVSPCA